MLSEQGEELIPLFLTKSTLRKHGLFSFLLASSSEQRPPEGAKFELFDNAAHGLISRTSVRTAWRLVWETVFSGA